jgi:hypothetical protein
MKRLQAPLTQGPVSFYLKHPYRLTLALETPINVIFVVASRGAALTRWARTRKVLTLSGLDVYNINTNKL